MQLHVASAEFLGVIHGLIRATRLHSCGQRLSPSQRLQAVRRPARQPRPSHRPLSRVSPAGDRPKPQSRHRQSRTVPRPATKALAAGRHCSSPPPQPRSSPPSCTAAAHKRSCVHSISPPQTPTRLPRRSARRSRRRSPPATPRRSPARCRRPSARAAPRQRRPWPRHTLRRVRRGTKQGPLPSLPLRLLVAWRRVVRALKPCVVQTSVAPPTHPSLPSERWAGQHRRCGAGYCAGGCAGRQPGSRAVPGKASKGWRARLKQAHKGLRY